MYMVEVRHVHSQQQLWGDVTFLKKIPTQVATLIAPALLNTNVRIAGASNLWPKQQKKAYS